MDEQEDGAVRGEGSRSPDRYPATAILLHWLIAGLLIFEFSLGLRMEALDGRSQFVTFQLHKSVGITILVLVGLRLLWRLFGSAPRLTVTGWQKKLANIVHRGFYLLLLVLPLSGWLAVSTSRITMPTVLYGAISWPHFPGTSALSDASKAFWNELAVVVHIGAVLVLCLFVVLHLAGALKHHFIDRKEELAKMLPGIAAGSWRDWRFGAVAALVIVAATAGGSWSSRPVLSAQEKGRDQIRELTGNGALKDSGVATAIPATEPETGRPEEADSAEAAGTEEIPSGQELTSWTVTDGSAIAFRTSWSGEEITGGFRRFAGDIRFGPADLDKSSATITIDMTSAFSGDSQRDETLKGSDWFSVSDYGKAVFSAMNFRRTGEHSFVARGFLKMKGMELPVSLPFTLRITGDRAIARGSTSIDRTAFRIGEGEFGSTDNIPAKVTVEVVVHAKRKG